MKRMNVEVWALPIALSLVLPGCRDTKSDAKAEAPSPVKVENEDFNVIQVDHPEQFPLATAVEYVSERQFTVSGTVYGDTSRTVPVLSMAAATAVDIHARLAGMRETRQILPRAQRADGSAAFSDDREPEERKLASLTHVWIVCEVQEGDLRNVNVGETVEIHLDAYPDRVFTGRISDMGLVLEPATRTAKVRIEVRDPGLMREGMSVTATFRGNNKEMHAAVPATAILHFHDRDWVYVPNGHNTFRRVDVAAGNMLPGNMREVLAGITPGTQVVKNALGFQKTVER